MKVEILDEHGHEIALFGIGLSYAKTSRISFDKFKNVDLAPGKHSETGELMEQLGWDLSVKDTGENKFLESIAVWLDITAPRYWWQQADTYRIGVTKQSESTMHTLLSRPLSQDNFSVKLPEYIIQTINNAIYDNDLELAKALLPESFLQRRIVCLNYKVLRHIYQQRHDHTLKEWRLFCEVLINNLREPEYIT